MRIIARAATAAIAVLAAGSALGACASSKTTSAPPTTTSTTPASTTSPPPPTTTTEAPTSTTTCQPSQLHIVKSGSQGAAGTIEITFLLTNTSTTDCTMYGYPGMLLLNTAGSPQPTTVDRGGGLAFENVAETDVSLTPGQTAYFNLGYNDVVSQPPACSMASQVEITPPNDTSYAVVAVPTIDACANGTLHVSPVFASTDSAATQTTAPS
jgi:Protein of unknown function (DUF4232)